MGVMVENGIVREGTPICVPSKEVNIKIFYQRLIFVTYIIKMSPFIFFTFVENEKRKKK